MTALADELRAMIAQEGPVTVERFMALALGHPRHGYYMTRDPFGTAGDFTTAPEISQMFGELLGLWAAEVWHAMGCPDPVRLVELGPGRGTLMADAVRAAQVLPPFRAALDIHLVETSPVLRQMQKMTLDRSGSAATWHATADTVPDGPAIVLANEFFDALPIRQFVWKPEGFHERLVGLDQAGALAFGLSPEPVGGAGRREPGRAELDTVVEHGDIGCGIVGDLTRRLIAGGGAMLVVDYGAAGGTGDTLQAVKSHRSVDPLTDPGEADLTAHVDFAALARAASRAGGATHGPVRQGAFLERLGLSARAAKLGKSATPPQRAALDAAVSRLAGPAPGMGELFKVLAITDPRLPPPPGFSDIKP